MFKCPMIQFFGLVLWYVFNWYMWSSTSSLPVFASEPVRESPWSLESCAAVLPVIFTLAITVVLGICRILFSEPPLELRFSFGSEAGVGLKHPWPNWQTSWHAGAVLDPDVSYSGNWWMSEDDPAVGLDWSLILPHPKEYFEGLDFGVIPS